jgi:small subunit ribosomal protein S18
LARKNRNDRNDRNDRNLRDRNDRNLRDRNLRSATGSMLNLRQRKRFCYFCRENISNIDYKNVSLLEKFISDKGKIRPKRSTGNCVQHQRKIAMGIKRARVIALIPYFKR